MTRLGENLALLLVRELEGFRREIAMFGDDETLFRMPPAVPNSVGNLALHVAGNLQEFVGRILGGVPYARNRPIEFGRRSGTRDEVAAELDVAVRVVQDVLPGLSQERLEAEYPEKLDDRSVATDRFLMHLCTHAAYHLGQAVNVRRMLTGDSRSSGPIPLRALTP